MAASRRPCSSPLELAGPGTLDVGYSTDTTPCTTELDRPPTDCPAGTWADGRDASTAAFRGRCHLRRRRSAPGRLDGPALPDGGAARADRARRRTWSPGTRSRTPSSSPTTAGPSSCRPTEPIKTGVALVFGDLTVHKIVVDSTGDRPVRLRLPLHAAARKDRGRIRGRSGRGRHRRLHPGRRRVRHAAPPCRPGPPARCGRPTRAGLISDADGEANAKTATSRSAAKPRSRS